MNGGVIDHVGNNQTRVFKEVKALGGELEHLGEETLGAVTDAKVAIYFDWDNWWAIECSAGPSCELKYKDEIFNYYQALHAMNIPVDFVGVEDELSKYSLVIAPVLYMTKNGYDEKIRQFVKDGGTFVTTFFSGIADEHDLVITGGYPGKLRDILGIWVEESDALAFGAENAFIYDGKRYPSRLICDLSHLEGAQTLGKYELDFYAGMPAVTKHIFGKGNAYYIATRSNAEFYQAFLGNICKEEGIESLVTPQEYLEATIRENENGKFLFLLNHGMDVLTVALPKAGEELLLNKEYQAGENIEIPAKGVCIVKVK